MPAQPPPSARGEFQIAIVCALPLEADAVDLLFDEYFDLKYGKASGDSNTYTTGRISGHAVVLLQLPGMGPLEAAAGSASLRSSFPNVTLALLVGICGGLPIIHDHNAYLGDIVLSTSIANYGFGKLYTNRFVPKKDIEDSLGRANKNIRGILASFKGERGMERLRSTAGAKLSRLQKNAVDRRRRTDYRPPPDKDDWMFPSDYDHKHRQGTCRTCTSGLFCEDAAGLSCTQLGCDESRCRKTRSSADPSPRIFLGRIASGNAVIKSGIYRNEIAREHNAIAFEMEGAGAWDEIPCIVVKGICDYADSHKSKLWQSYAAATAASVAASILDQYELSDLVPAGPSASAAGPSASAAGPSAYAAISSASAPQELPIPSAGQPGGGNTALHHSGSGHVLQGNVIHGDFNFGGTTSKSSSDGPHWLVPRAGHPLFTGRSEIIATIRQAISADGSHYHRIFVLGGLGGQGKSEVCLQVANRVRQQFWGVFWVDVGTSESAQSGFSQISTLLGAPQSSADETVAHALGLLGKEVHRNHRWLLILDNADDAEVDYHNYIPSGSQGAILITSRLRDCQALNTAGCQELQDLGEDECTDLLLRAAGRSTSARDPSPEDKEAAKAVVRLLGGHTLALVHAGAYVRRGRCSMAEYPAEYQAQQARILNFAPGQSRSRYSSVYATFEASAHALGPPKSPEARTALDLLDLFSVLHFRDIPLDLFQDAWKGAQDAKDYSSSNHEMSYLTRWHVRQIPNFLQSGKTWDHERLFSEAMSRLQSLALVTEGEARGARTVSLHPLVHQWLDLRQTEKSRRKRNLAGACVLALSKLGTNWEWQPYWLILSPHLPCLLEKERWLVARPRPSPQELQLLYCISVQLYRDGRYDDANIMLNWILRLLGAQDKGVSKKNLAIFRDIGVNLVHLRQSEKAILYLKPALRYCAKDLLEDGGLHIQLLGYLVTAYRQSRQYEQPIAHLEKARDMTAREQPGGDEYISILYDLGMAYNRVGKHKDAVATLEKVVEYLAGRMDKMAPELLISQGQLGVAYNRNGEHEKAIEIHRYVLSMWEAAAVEKSNHDRLAALHNLACAYILSGQPEKSVGLLREVVRIQATTLREDHPHRVSPQNALARAEQMIAKAKDASDANQQQEEQKMSQRRLSRTGPGRLAPVLRTGCQAR